MVTCLSLWVHFQTTDRWKRERGEITLEVSKGIWAQAKSRFYTRSTAEEGGLGLGGCGAGADGGRVKKSPAFAN